MTFTISALEAEDPGCQEEFVCVAVSHSGDNRWEHLGLSPGQTWEDSSASTPSEWRGPSPGRTMAFAGQGDSFLTCHTSCLCCSIDFFSFLSNFKCYD